MTAPGLFLCLDGIDGTGKSTQCRLLADWIRGLGRVVTPAVDPGGTPLGQALRALVLDHRQTMSLRAEMLVFMASRAELVEAVIRPALTAGGVVVCDRYLVANVVYQGHAGGMEPDDVWELGVRCAGGVLPDLTLLLDLPLEDAVRRRGREPDRMERRDTAFQERVRDGFRVEAARARGPTRLIDAAGDVAAVQERLRDAVRPLVGVA